MKILLVGVDYKEVNIALGKISTYHKQLGDSVDLIKLGLSGYPKGKTKNVDASDYDKVYVSQLFEINTGRYSISNCDNVEVGGVGSIYPNKVLPDEIERSEIDYSIFDTDTSFGFITRGCIRDCYFCKVPKTEGKLHWHKHPSDIIKHKKVKFMDNNILAFREHKKVLQWLIDNNIKCQFNQGLDIRLINDENAKLLSEMRYMGKYLFAFDDVKDEKHIERGLSIFQKYVDKPWMTRFFVYHNAEFTSLKDTIYRIEWLKERGALPYLMRDTNCWTSKHDHFLKDYATYVNQPHFFCKMSFEDFLTEKLSAKIKPERLKNDMRIYKENK